MAQPEGFTDPLRPHHTCKLCKELYSLKQAPQSGLNVSSLLYINGVFIVLCLSLHCFLPLDMDPKFFFLCMSMISSSLVQTLVIFSNSFTTFIAQLLSSSSVQLAIFLVLRWYAPPLFFIYASPNMLLIFSFETTWIKPNQFLLPLVFLPNFH